MVRFLSQDWLDLQRDIAGTLPEHPGASARLQYVVAGSPEGEVRYHQAVLDGRLVESALGDDPGAQATLTETYPDARAIAEGELDLSAAFMRGRVKVVGGMGPVMALMPLFQSDEHRSLLAAVAAQTEF